MKTHVVLALVLMALFPSLLLGATPADFDELLREVKTTQSRERRLNTEREESFLKEKTRRNDLLREARMELAAEKRRGDQLRYVFDSNEKQLTTKEATLRERLGVLGELFGTVRQSAGDLKGVIDQSLVSAQYPGRSDFLQRLSRTRELPNVDELEQLWFVLLQEMTESGKVVSFPAEVVAGGGERHDAMATRVGVFSVVANGRYLHYLPESGRLAELPRQPAGRYLKLAENIESVRDGVTPMAIDPSRGAILEALVQSPGLGERIRQGGSVGFLILALGGIGLILAGERLGYLALIGSRVQRQLKNLAVPCDDNPLGRVLLVPSQARSTEPETLELMLDEAILREAPRLERGQAMLKLLAAVAPLLGLLGTVTGMIATFQSITLFGTGDPKLMANGISQALVTTALGLVVAIPLVFLHNLVASRSKSLVRLLDEQSAGLLATGLEEGK
ncbi:MotA/TolQ/ExbB proton channel family protein [Desulfuromonas sp. AOP6]|uniref:MotA/TolQ/ExbB proton channel family protein n=1 Tax=Desulfuromonas sp. AOP6 TaxID=1566351 RepID=UPI001284E4EE|nr:MotA/TolQ/ExbB proton channel family protein [Desulfuromonas sp. AOP6]BCA79042.1 biopolymer transporter ExbB [Desulfuromonas sp. AOP6]